MTTIDPPRTEEPKRNSNSRQAPGVDSSASIPARSAWWFKLFRNYARRYVCRHLHALRISRGGPIPDLPPGPVIMVMNHPSWWDPLVGLVLTGYMPPWRAHFAPIDIQGLTQYRFLERIGFYGIEPDSAHGGMVFLRRSLAILDQPASVLWITAQGDFIDPRDRPVRLKQGIGHLLHRLSSATVVPLAIEYPFWNDRSPEALVRFGTPIAVKSSRECSPRSWTSRIEGALEITQDLLAEQARRRDPTLFTTLLVGTAGVGGAYDLWRKFRSVIQGKPFEPEHRVRSEPIRELNGPLPNHPAHKVGSQRS